MLSNVWSDVRFTARSLSHTPGFAVTAVLILALGIGANVATFSLLQQVLLRPLPVAAPDRLVNFASPGPKLDPQAGLGGAAPTLSGGIDTVFSYPMFRDLERAQEPFVGIAAHKVVFDASLSTGERARLDSIAFVSGGYFQLLGLDPAFGRLLGPEDDHTDGQAEAVVLSHAYWQSEFGADPEVIGNRLIVSGQPLTIVGVAPAGFHGTTVGARPKAFVPITFRAPRTFVMLPNHDNRGIHWVSLFARLKPGVSREEAGAAINPLYRSILREVELPLWETSTSPQVLDEFRTRSIVLEPGARGQSAVFAPANDRLTILLAVSGVILLLCCANVAGLMLVRSSTRAGEMAVRASMGATPGRLASMLLAESMLLALPAAVASLAIAPLALSAIASRAPGMRVDSGFSVEMSTLVDVSLTPGASGFAVASAILAALIAGLLPLRNAIRIDPATTLQGCGARQTNGKGVSRFRAAVATVQIGLSMALLAMTGLFAQSLANIARIDLGIDVESVVTFSISPATSGYSAEASDDLLGRIEDELTTVPGVSSVASSQFPLLSGEAPALRIRRVAGVDVEEFVSWNVVSSTFFETLGIELLAGRTFGNSDIGNQRSVAIVNERFAERLRLDGDAVGSQLGFTTRGDVVEIIGLVANAKYDNVTGEIEPQIFQPRFRSENFFVRGALPGDQLLSAVRETVTRVDPVVPITGLATMEQQVRENLGTERFVAGASTAFAVIATLLAGLGLYGVLAYSVAQRSREIALRIALGATQHRVRRAVFHEVVAMALSGAALGVIATWLLGRAARSLLFDVGALNPVSLAGAATILVLVTLAAALLPARRAARVDPMSALRYE